jgi:hypothetical protein
MEITVTFKWYPGFGDKPRPALRVTARAQRRDAKGHLEEFIHTRTVDAAVPDTWVQGLDEGLATMVELRQATKERTYLREVEAA